jgi:hypothetical protein
MNDSSAGCAVAKDVIVRALLLYYVSTLVQAERNSGVGID